MEMLELMLISILLKTASNNLKLKTKKFIVGSEVELGGLFITLEKVKNQDLIFIAPKGKRIKAFEELCRPQTKRDCHVFSGMLSTVAREIPLITKATASKGHFILSDKMHKRMKELEKP